MSQPFVISYVLKYFEGTIGIIEAIEYGAILCIGTFIVTIIHHPLFLCNNIIGLKLRLSCSGLIYKKVLQFISIFFFNIVNVLKIRQFQI